jgi:hypothetical protein
MRRGNEVIGGMQYLRLVEQRVGRSIECMQAEEAEGVGEDSLGGGVLTVGTVEWGWWACIGVCCAK